MACEKCAGAAGVCDWPKGLDTPSGTSVGHHFSLSAQNAADILPLAMFLACLALNDALRILSDSDSDFRGGEPDTPC